jgi:hypothetical protein
MVEVCSVTTQGKCLEMNMSFLCPSAVLRYSPHRLLDGSPVAELQLSTAEYPTSPPFSSLPSSLSHCLSLLIRSWCFLGSPPKYSFHPRPCLRICFCWTQTKTITYGRSSFYWLVTEIYSFFFFSGGTGVWTQGLMSCGPSPLALVHFSDGSHAFAQLALDHDLPTYTF